MPERSKQTTVSSNMVKNPVQVSRHDFTLAEEELSHMSKKTHHQLKPLNWLFQSKVIRWSTNLEHLDQDWRH